MSKKKSDADIGVGGMLKGLGDLVEKLGQLAETGERLKRSGTFDATTEDGKPVKGAFGVSVRFGLGEQGMQVTPVSKPAQESQNEKTHVRELSDPPVDIFPGEKAVQVIAEMPGIGLEDVELQLFGDVLIIRGEKGPKRYYKETVLPFVCKTEQMETQCNNGILEINLLRVDDHE